MARSSYRKYEVGLGKGEKVKLSLYLEFIKKAFQERYAYRFDFLVSILGAFLAIFIQMNIWTALLSDHEAPPSSITLRDMLNYVIVSTMITGLTSSNVAKKIGERVETGMIAGDFLRPVHLKYFLWADDFGATSFHLLFVTLPICAFAALLYGFSFPSEPWVLFLFLISLMFSAIIIFHIQYILGMFAFWLQTSWFITWFLTAFNHLFSGSVVPLWYYPEWLYTISSLLPFRLISFDPITIYLGKQTFEGAVAIIFRQVVWVVILVLFERWLWLRVQKKVIVHGG